MPGIVGKRPNQLKRLQKVICGCIIIESSLEQKWSFGRVGLKWIRRKAKVKTKQKLWHEQRHDDVFLCILLKNPHFCNSSIQTLCHPMDCSLRLLCPWDSPGKNTGVGSYSLLQGIFPTPGIKPRSPALQVDFLLSEPPGKLFSILYMLNSSFMLSEEI